MDGGTKHGEIITWHKQMREKQEALEKWVTRVYWEGEGAFKK